MMESKLNLRRRIGSRILDGLSHLPYFKGKGLLALWTVRWLGREGPLTMRLPNGSRVWIGNDQAGHALLPYCIGKYEREFTQLFLRFLCQLSPGDCVVDLGANVGYYAVMAAWQLRRFEGSYVFSFEPNPQAFMHLQSNKALNHLDNLIAVPQAVGNQFGRMTLYINPNGITFGSLRPYLSHLVEQCDVQVVTLDGFLSQHPWAKIKLLKMDIEGAELLALQGARETLKRFRPVIFYEENESACHAFGYTAADLRLFLRELGYQFYLMKPTDVQNVIALPMGGFVPWSRKLAW